jgi:hypothetical protein
MRHTALVVALAAGCAACGSGIEDASRAEGFQRFTLSSSAGPCPSGLVCGRSIRLGAGGVLSGNEGHVVHQAQVSGADLAAARRVVTAPAFVALLENPPPCTSIVTDAIESMELETSGRLRSDPASACRSEPPVAAVRAEMERLRAAYFR